MKMEIMHLLVHLTFTIVVVTIATVLCKEDGAIAYTITNANTSIGPPIVTEGNGSTIIVQPRDNVELSCPIISTPKPLYEWYKENSYEPRLERIFGPSQQVWQRFELTNQGHLKIRSVTHEDSGTYICKAVNGFGAKSFSTRLAVTGDDPFRDNFLKTANKRNTSLPKINRDQLPKEKISSINKGFSVKLKCEATGIPRPNVTWFKGNKTISEPKEGVSELKMTNLTDRDAGKYRCEASNAFGKDEYEFMIKVIGSWSRDDEILELTPPNLRVLVGGSGNITCVARSEREAQPYFFWLKMVPNVTFSDKVMDTTNAYSNSSDIEKGFYRDGVYYKVLNRTEVKVRDKHVYYTELVLKDVSNSDAGTYYCAIVGLMGFNYSEANITVESDPMENAQSTMRREKEAAVQWAILWAFAFLIVAVASMFCVVRLYGGCHSPLKKYPPSVPERGVRESKRLCPTVATAVNQQNEAFQPLVHKCGGSSYLSDRSLTRTDFDVSLTSNSGAAASDSCQCHCTIYPSHCLQVGNAKRSHGRRMSSRPYHIHKNVSSKSSSHSHYAISSLCSSHTYEVHYPT